MKKNKKQIIIIGGGEAWNTYEEYVGYLKEKKYDPYEERADLWSKTIGDVLGEDYETIKLSMPSPDNAKYKEWAIWFEKLLPYMNEEIVLIGHSLGANFLAKYLSENAFTVSIEQLHLVAGCYGVGGGFELSDSLEKVGNQCDKIYIYHSIDDPIVDYSDAEKYMKALPKAELVRFDDRHHFIQEEFPEIVENIKN
ncbi:MAG: alpha/beta hydrolase [Patescibacteria group bacterium]